MTCNAFRKLVVTYIIPCFICIVRCVSEIKETIRIMYSTLVLEGTVVCHSTTASATMVNNGCSLVTVPK